MSARNKCVESSSASFDLSTNLAQLPYGIFCALARQLDVEELWQDLLSDKEQSSPYSLSAEERNRCKRVPEPGVFLLRLLGNRGQNVKGFLAKLHSLAKTFGPRMDAPQLILHRSFRAVIWSRAEQVLVTIEGEENERLRLQCKATGFPTPRYQWFEEKRALEGASHSSLIILRCPCTARNVFRCRVWNEVEEGQEWSDFYRANGKAFQSELLSDVVDLGRFMLNGSSKNCENCQRQVMEDLAKKFGTEQMMNGAGGECSQQQQQQGNRAEAMLTTMMTEELVATDKVALIISNRTYAPQMSNLITPHCDAQTLAEALQQLQFKTVTLGDLNLAEMRAIIAQYRKLLGEGVYAIFYFVGHGFEANGQCYLLPIGAPSDGYGPADCVSMDWVMRQFREFNPALNLVLLDMCRKFLPSNLDAFTKYAEQFKQGDIRVNRNTVYGYATSEGIGAYEVKGETNGVFMKYLKRRIHQARSLLDMLNKVFLDIERDKKVCDVQIPELRSNLTKPRSLLDPLVSDGHTTSYDHHTWHWKTMHELPEPVYVNFIELRLQVTIWFDFCGLFTNKVYVFSSVGDLLNEDDDGEQVNGQQTQMATGANREMLSERAASHVAYLRFSEEFECSPPKLCEDDEEGVSLCVMLSHLQKAKHELRCRVELCDHRDGDRLVTVREHQLLGHVLITRFELAATSERDGGGAEND